jgi:hypothetical protein
MPARSPRRDSSLGRVERLPLFELVDFEHLMVPLARAVLRFVELTSERCAVVWSARSAVQKVVRSASFTREIAAGVRVAPSSVAWDSVARGQLDDRAQPVAATRWLRTTTEVEIIEHSAVLAENPPNSDPAGNTSPVVAVLGRHTVAPCHMPIAANLARVRRRCGLRVA